MDAGLKLDPRLLELRSNKAMVLIDQQHLDDALGILEETLQVDPMHVDSLVNKGVVLSRLGRIDDAIGHFSLALKAKPDTPEIIRNRMILMNYSPSLSASQISLIPG